MLLQTLLAVSLSLGIATTPIDTVFAQTTMHSTSRPTTHLTKSSGDWAITFTGHGPHAVAGRDFVPCNFTVINKGQLVNDVTIELYRPLANKQKHSMALVGGTVTTDLMKHGEEVTLGNLPILNNVDQVEFVITWKLDGRKYMQSLFFTGAELRWG